jgi:Cu2+-exporting ATPase
MGAYAFIHEQGLDDYYAMRSASTVASVQSDPRYENVLDDLQAAGVDVQSIGGGLSCVRLSVDGMHCAACSWLIERLQPTIQGLHRAQVRMSDQTIELVYDQSQTSPAHVARKLGRLGYRLSPWHHDELDTQAFLLQQRQHWMGIASAAFFAANAMWIGIALYAGESTGMASSHADFLRWVGLGLAVLAAIFPGRIFFTTAWQAIRSRTTHIDIPIALSIAIGLVGGIVGAISGSGHIYFDSLASLILLLRVGRYIQFRAQAKASHWISQWMRMHWLVATRLENDGSSVKVPAYRLAVGDRVRVQANETVPADGVLEAMQGDDANSYIDMSLFNGEANPSAVSVGEPLLGGTTNLSDAFIMRVTASGEASRVGKLMELVRNATTHRTPWTLAADRISKWFVMVVMIVATVTWIAWAILSNPAVATGHAMALLTIACPCALALAAPLVLTIAMGRAAKNQVWIRDGDCLEKLSSPGSLWLDKTGTLTHGRMQVVRWRGNESWLPLVALLESNASHPVATAIVDYVRRNFAPASNVYQASDSFRVEQTRSLIGRGIVGIVNGDAFVIGTQPWLVENNITMSQTWLEQQRVWLDQGLSVVWIAVNGNVEGLLAMGDCLREEVAATLIAASQRGWRLGIASGDRQEVVDKIAAELKQQGVAIAEAVGGLMPEDKQELIRASRHRFKGPCVMVGDGINDAAALASADVGIAIRGGSDHSLQAAPVYLANGRIESLIQLLDAAKQSVRGIRRCFVISLVYNTLTISLAALGWIHPLIAAIMMPISGISVLLLAVTTRTFQTPVAISLPENRERSDSRSRIFDEIIPRAEPRLTMPPLANGPFVHTREKIDL